jgi:hypothetical protein
MLARLGNVLYWTGSLLTTLLVALAIALYNVQDIKTIELLFLVGLAVVVWLIGRACRYVLAGR